MSSFIFLHVTIFVLLISSVFGIGEGIFNKIKIGLQNAKNYLQIARDIADLVSKSLKTKQTPSKSEKNTDFNNENEQKPFYLTNLVSTFFRILGLNVKEVTAVTVNSFIFLAQLISELFDLNPKVEHFRAVDELKKPLDPIQIIRESKNEKIQYLLRKAQDNDLPNQLIAQTEGIDFSCIRLLLCKTSPIIWAAQKSLQNNSKNIQDNMTSWLPSKDKFEEYSDTCDNKHNDCPLNFAL